MPGGGARPAGNRSAPGHVLKILFITSNRLGDAVLSTGLLGHLVAAYPGARVTVACGPLPAPLFRAVPGLDRVIPMRKRSLSAHWLALWRTVVGTRWDLVVDLRDSAVSRLVWARRRAVRCRPRQVLHKVEENALTLALSPAPAPRLWLSPADRAAAADLIPAGMPVLAVGPAANWIGKTWPAESFAELVRRLTAPDGILPGGRVAVLATAGERSLAQPVVEAVEPARCLDLVGRTDPLLAAACLERCAFYVGNDSGLMHIAAAMGVPTLGLFGPGSPERYGPWGPRAAVVATAVPPALVAAALRPDGGVLGSLMDGLSVDAVVAAADKLARQCRLLRLECDS